ncbi:MAG: TonB-dependent receptor [Caulobacteraceae bacterium]|nr:TonB-dependent receptor [Caulobacter sp.]
MGRTVQLLAGASSLALILAATAHGQTAVPPQPSPDAESEALVVTASRSGDAVSADLLGESATVITDQDLKERQTRVVSDVLRDAPGVEVSRSGGVGGLTQVRIRGAEANQTLVLIDGVKASDPYDGEFDFGTLIADEDARIEVLRGQQSSLYGSDAIGGVIQYFTLTGAEAPGLKLRVGGGSMGTFEGAARAAGVVGTLDYAFNASAITTDGYPTAIGGARDVGSSSATASAKLLWTPLADLHLTGVFRYERTDADTNDTDNVSGSPTFGLPVDSPGVHYVNDGYYGLVRGQLDSLGGRWTNAVTLQTADTTRTGYDVADPYSPIAGQPVAAAFGDHGRRYRGSYESSLRLDDGPLQQRLTFATDAEQESERTTLSTYGAFTGWRYTTNVGLVGEYELTHGQRFALGGSVRHDFNDRFADSTTYRVQGSYLLPYDVRVHAAGGSGVKAPSFSELFDTFVGRYIGNPDLRPEKSEGWEVGLERRFPSQHATVSATYFDNLFTDEIETAYTAAGAMPFNRAGSSRQQGVELALTADLTRALKLDASYTYLDAPQTENVLINGADTLYTGEAVRRARNTASANLTWAPPGSPFSTTLTVRYNGEQGDYAYTDPSFEPLLVRLKDFTLVNLNAAYQLTPHLQLYGRLENALDQRYAEVFGFAAAGVAGYGGIRARF